MKVVVGLGNPGEQYKNTRHNIGWLALDYLLGDVRWQENKKFRALVHEDNGTIYLKPLTFMNNSGDSVRRALDYYGLLPKNDLDLGKWKISDDSRSGGHKGVQSIINHLKTQRFIRLRLGIKNGELRRLIPPEKFVLQKFSTEELPILQDSIKKGLAALKPYIP